MCRVVCNKYIYGKGDERNQSKVGCHGNNAKESTLLDHVVIDANGLID
jgi:hypothetical protein